MQSSSPSALKSEALMSSSIKIRLRLLGWSLVLAIGPLLMLVLLLRPDLDLAWQNPALHVVMVSMSAMLGVLLALLVLWLADEQQDGRTLLVGFAFLTIASMFFIHAIAVPDVLMSGRSQAAIWSPAVGLSVGGVLLALSSFSLSAHINRLLTLYARGWLGVLLLLLGGYVLLMLVQPVASSLSGLPIDTLPATLGPLNGIVVVIGVVGYLIALLRYARRAPGRLSAANTSLVSGVVLLCEALVVQQLSHVYGWSFWLYQVQAIAGLLAISWSVLRRYRGSTGGNVPENLFLPSTLTRIQDGYAQAITELLYSLSQGMVPSHVQRADLRQRFKLGEGQLLMLEQAATAVAVERQRRQQIEHLNARLRQVERDRTLLTQMIIHDLKTPITAIGGTLDVLAYVPLDGEVTELVTNARRSVRTLRGLVGDLLDMGQMQEGRLELQKTTFPAAALLSGCADELRGWALENHKSIRVDVPSEPVPITGDRRLLQRVVLNLVSNAIKHTPPETEIVLLARPEVAGEASITGINGGAAVIEVIDSGPGMTPELIATIFDRYVSTSSEESAGQRNTGLGLTFCKLAVEAHHGVIAVVSTPGVGTVVRVTLPRQEG